MSEAHSHAESAHRKRGTSIKMTNQAPPPGATPEQESRKGGWICTYTGRPFWPCDPRIEDIDIADIAHALSNQCRFAGHVTHFYSVAEHCIRVSRILPPEMALWGLLHDAAEAYLVDLPRPLKHTAGLGEEYQRVEANLMRVICRKFGLPLAEPVEVKLADVVMLETERVALLPCALWAMDVEPLDFGPRELGMAPEMAEAQFLWRFRSLYPATFDGGAC